MKGEVEMTNRGGEEEGTPASSSSFLETNKGKHQGIVVTAARPPTRGHQPVHDSVRGSAVVSAPTWGSWRAENMSGCPHIPDTWHGLLLPQTFEEPQGIRM